MFSISKEYLFVHWLIIQFSECPAVILQKLRNSIRLKMIGRNLNVGFHYCFVIIFQNCPVIVLSLSTTYLSFPSEFFQFSEMYTYVCMNAETHKTM